MKIEKRFGERKKGNSKKSLLLVALLIFVLYLFFNADAILEKIF